MKSRNLNLDSIPFEKVLFSDAKAVLDGDEMRVKMRKEQQRWESLRHLNELKDQDLLESTYHWFAKLPTELKPWELARYFPRVTNQLAEIWSRPVDCAKFLGQLLLDDRGSRKGFPENVVREIMSLQSHLEMMSANVSGTREIPRR